MPSTPAPRKPKAGKAKVFNAPDRIFLNLGLEGEESVDFKDLHEVTWCVDRQFPDDIEYVRVTPKPGGPRAAKK